MVRASAALFLLFLSVAPATAEDRQIIGWGRIFNNDLLGDTHDRWRSGSYALSMVRAPEVYDGRSQPFGDLLEYRLRAEIIASRHGLAAPGDRPYAGIVSLGLHTHFGLGPAEASVGLDAVALGPGTGVSAFQEWFHDAFSLPDPPFTGGQLGNAVHLAGTAELAWPLRLSDRLTLRPFVEAQTGVEEIARAGGDVILGAVGQQDLMLRDVVTGQLYRGTEAGETGFGFVAGADWAAVGGSVFLPEDLGLAAVDERWRARAGVHWQIAPTMSFYYGLTWLSPEFEGQPEGQILGSLKLNLNF